jgi:hypothetical protein
VTRAPHGDDPEWDAYYDDITEGWITFVHQLAFALEHHPGEARHTLFYAGTGDRSPSPAELFKLTAAVGSEYATDLCGEAATGRVYFRSDNQVGVTVDQWGDGLLVLSHIGATEKKPNGAAMAVLTFYGLDDATRESIDKRWQAWWTPRYPSEDQPLS